MANIDFQMNRVNHSTASPGSLGNLGADIAFETLLKIKKQAVESITGLELLPTYSYARIYQYGNDLHKHKDRESCEISVTCKLGESKKYDYPIIIEGNEINLDQGDAVIYKGCEVEHWRNRLDEPDYYLGQVFLHYVDKNGQYESFKYDKFYEKEIFFTTDLTKEQT